MEDPSHFYVQYADPQSMDRLTGVDGRIRQMAALCGPPAGRPQTGRLYLAPFLDQGVVGLFRARVECVQQRECQVS